MERSKFIGLRAGDRVQMGTIKFTVLQNKLEYFPPELGVAGATIVYLTPDDDNYILKVGHEDEDVLRIHKLDKGE